MEAEQQKQSEGQREEDALFKEREREKKKPPSLHISRELELIKWFHYCPPLLLR